MIQVVPCISQETRDQIDNYDVLVNFYKEKSPATILAYQRNLNEFIIFSGCSDMSGWLKMMKDIRSVDLNKLINVFRSSMIDKKLSSSTINSRISTLKTIVNQMRIYELTTAEVMVKGIKSEPARDNRGITNVTYDKLLRVLEGSDFESVRDRTIMSLMASTAFRRAEVAYLKVDDVDLEEKVIKIKEKGHMQSTRYTMADDLHDVLLAYKEKRDELLMTKKPAEEPDGFFLKDNCTNLKPSAIYYIVKRTAEKAKIDKKKVHPHSFRHLSVTNAIDIISKEGRPITDVQRFSRHRQLNTLQLYADSFKDDFGNISSKLAKAKAPKPVD